MPIEDPADGLDVGLIINPGKRLTRAQLAVKAASERRAAAPPVKRVNDDEEGDAIASDFD